MLRHTIKPRLNGLFGQTLKKLIATDQYLRIDAGQSYKFISSFSGNVDCLPTTKDYDLGFFTDSLSRDYFMLISRYYNNDGSCPVFINFNPNYFGYNNISLTKYVEDTTYTVLNDASIQIDLTRGDAELFKVTPVVLFGGTLIADDAAGVGETLKGDMIIDNGATLSIYQNYYAQGDIIIKNGSIENYDPNSAGTIHFQNGKKLIIEGAATISGTSTHRLTFDFTEDSMGVVIKPGGSLIISYCNIQNAAFGIKAEPNAQYLSAQYVDLTNCRSSSIMMLGKSGGEGPLTPPPSEIKYCTMTNSPNGWGINVSNLPEIIIQGNTISNTNFGIFLSQISNAQVINNTLVNSTTAQSFGLFMGSTGGNVRGNTISNFYEGLRIANSSPEIGGNNIYGNRFHGIFIANGSNPDMTGSLLYDITFHGWYAVSGYNNIYENGGYLEYGNDGAEIYFSNAFAQMSDGCNSIKDNRIPEPDPQPGELAYTQYLMNGTLSSGVGRTLNAENNFWDEHPVYPLSTRFGSLSVDYIPYKDTVCEIPSESSGEGMLVTMTSTGEVIDTLYPVKSGSNELSNIEILYGSAEKLFLTGEVESSESYYDQVISSDTTLTEKLKAYKRKYEIGRLLNRDEGYFADLRNTYLTLAEATYDTLNKKIFNQLSILCLPARQEYLLAINEFDEIIQQNPNTEEAVYAEIDAITTALLVEGNDSLLQKSNAGRYLVKEKENYLDKLSGIFNKNFGTNKEEEEKEIIPTEYTLYQNYPNPFNPVTTIKYDIPNTGEVTVVIYDILGRKIKELVNTKQQAGRYEVKFDATNLASGVYLYQLRTKDYISTKKMILLK